MANTNLTGLFTDIADSIRAKDGTTAPIAAINFADRINAIPTGGSTEFQYRTPDEIYEQDRPADWPVLPDPQEGECYFLFNRDGSSELRVVYDESMLSNYNQTSSWGYINENGEFVSVYTLERTGSSSTPTPSKWEWLRLGSSGAEANNKMYPYYVLKTVGGGFYQGEGHSSPSSESFLGQYLLEAKINIPNAEYVLNRYGSLNPSSSQTNYLNLHNNLKFITLYNGTGKNLQLRYLCYNKGALRCIRFDSEANNFFTNGNFNGGNSAAYMFYGAVSLQCTYPIDKLTTVKNISYLYGRNRYLPYLEIHSSTATTAERVIGAGPSCCKKASIILPRVTSSYFSIGNCPPELINFQLPALSPANEYTIISSMPSDSSYYKGVIKNVNLPNSKCYNWATRQRNGVSAITFTEDCPPPDGVTFDCCSFSHQTLQDMIDTLPIAEGATLTIKFESLSAGNTPYYASVGISQKERDAFIQQITDKGYTVSVTLQ